VKLEDTLRENERLRCRVAELENIQLRLTNSERALRESEQRFRVLYENAPLAYQSLDENGNFLAVNQAWLDNLGYSRGEVIGKWCGDFLTESYREKFKVYFPQFKALGEIHGLEFEMLKKDGSTVLVSADGKIGRDDKGKFKQTHCLLRDITEVREMEQALSVREKQYQTLVENMPDLIVRYDSHLRRIYVNPAWEEASGLAASDVINVPPAGIPKVPSPVNVPYLEGLRHVLETGNSEKIEFTWMNAHGRELILEYVMVPEFDRHGKIVGVLAVGHDLTERKQVEERLRLLDFALDHVREAAFLTDENARFQFVNEESCRILGYTRSELLGLGVSDIDPDFPMDRWLSHWNDLKTKGSLIFEGRHKAKDGRIFPVEINANNFEYRGQGYNLALVRDITERKQEENVRLARLRLMEFADTHTLEELLQATLDEAEALTGSLIGFYHFVDSDQRTLWLQAWSTRTLREMCTAEGKGLHYDVNEAGVWVECVHERKPVIHNDYPALSHRRGMPIGHAKVTRELVVPVFRRDRIVAILGVGNKPANYEQSDVEIVSLLADLAWDIAERKLADENLRRSEAKFLDLYENAPCAYLSLGTDAVIRLCNQRAGELLGYSREELIGKSVFELYANQPEGKEKAEFVFKRFLAGEPIADEELQMQKADGSTLWISLTVNGIRDSEGHLVESRSMVLDISDRKRAEETQRRLTRELRAISNCNQTLLRAVDEQTLVDDICRIICDEAGYRLAWVGYAENDDAKTIRPVAWAGFDRGYVTGAKLTWADDTERGQGPAGTVIRSGETVYVQDFATDPRMAPWRERALQAGYRSGLALPLKDESAKVFGVLLIYHSESNAITPTEVQLMEELAGDLAFGIVTLRTRADRKRAEEDLQKMNERFALATNAASLGVWDWDILKNELVWDDGMYELYGIKREDFAGAYEAWLNGVHPDDRPTSHEVSKLAQRGERDYDTEFRVVWPDGSIHYLKAYGQVVRDPRGTPLRMTGINFDVTEPKLAEEAILRLASIVESSDDAIIGKTLEGDIVSWNTGAERLYGYTAGEVIGKPISMLVPHGLLDELPEILLKIKTGEAVVHLETKRLRKDGRIVDVSVTVSPIKNPAGEILGASSIVRDITERKQSEEAVRRANEDWEQTFNAIPDMVMVLDSHHRILRANEAMAAMLGRSEQELQGKFCFELVHDTNKPPAFCPHSGLLKDGREHATELFEPKLARSLDVRVSPLSDDKGTVIGSVHIVRDITEQKNLQKQLLQAQKMESLGTLAGGIAHDFNNLLQIIIGYSDMLLFGRKPEDRAYEGLHAIHQAGKEGAEMAKNILAFSRRLEPNARPVNLNNEILRAKKMLERTVSKMIQIQILLADNLMTVNADPGQLDQIILNLAVNAQHAMPDGGRLTIETANVVLDADYSRSHLNVGPGKYVLLSVSDTGHGMAKEVLEHIFEPFYTTKGVDEGTGLGLAMVYGIVKSHKGHILCYSEPRAGTTFKIYLPAVVVETEQSVIVAQREPDLGTETILLVDDEKRIRKLGEEMLRMAGYTVLTARNGIEALQIYRANQDRIAIVLLDLMMPEMGGRECLEGLLGMNPSVKVIIASGFRANGPTKDELKAGAKAFVDKPYDMRQVLEVVRTVLDAD
jgi:two-component system, cell cycle sensor histidine kinase and response regulator CckA